MKTLNELKKEIVHASQTAFDQKLFAGTSGNLSVYIKEQNKVIITPSCVRYETMTIDDLVVIDLDGNVLEGYNVPSSEWRMHCAIYKNKEDVSAVFHTHSPYATSFAVVNKTIPTILIEMVPFLGGAVEVAKFARPGTEDVGLEALKVLEGKGGCLLASHGVLTIGDSIGQSYIRAEYVEDAAKIYHYALQAGEPQVISDEMINLMKNS